MKIPNIGKDGLRITTEPVAKSRQSSKTSGKSDRVQQDRVELSRDALQLLESDKRLRSGEEVRTDLVERLRKQVADGTYAPDSNRVAEKMIAQAAMEPSEE